MSWDEVLPEKIEELRELFHTFLESGGTTQDCVELLNESLGYLGITASASASPSANTNRIQLPSTNNLRRMYNQRNRSKPNNKGYTTPKRPPPPIPRGFTTPNPQSTPFSPPRRNSTRKRPRLNIYNSNSNSNTNTRKTNHSQ